MLSKFKQINPFLANVPILYPLKTPENLGAFSGYKMGTLARNGLMSFSSVCNVLAMLLQETFSLKIA